jgi:acetoacetyl-CoA reductase
MTATPASPFQLPRIANPARPLEGHVAVVTGGSRGIGASIALMLGQQGADVAINYRSKKAEAEEVAQRIEKSGSRAMILGGDVTILDDIQRIREEVNAGLGRPTVLVNNAGVNVDMSFKKMTPEAWHAVVDTNLTAVFNVTKTFLNDLIAQPGGRIVTISSFVGQKGNYGQTNYAASKGGIIAFTKTLAVELARDRCTVNAVAPGFIETDMLRGVPPRIQEKLLQEIPLGRFGAAEEVAHAVSFLAHPMSGYISGEILNVNGGVYMG